mmetsp:Transcript_9823/g.23138  ORF Transcript_9823/g.23138 Transcript_9823/m.23138 type:complete len:1131 (-) Transcript_9823:53-3445(-)|eukprot:CAMPEP_0113647884 /NCGR_PEP_ID=MMETSP0017_2-20120614/25374_1 /TAXON_ID=2856 /ORGANISM="Cylindrotheca closterium" /LENGTH=1130 /DNA_ID=CAMNT_0000560021 /DNA_START=27 /DNA_END=3419 /DNA_ORIENTATION=- /assembly_acc=CAM_ASM_000147
MHRPRRRQKKDDIESDGVFGRTNLSATREGLSSEKKRNLKIGGALLAVCLLIVIIGTVVASAVGGDGPHIVVGHPAFTEVLNEGYVADAKANIKMMSHTKSGMSIMTVVPNDVTQDATFGVSFRTPITDNRGLATITEHAIQAGSKTYPVKDPINQLQAGSLQTHLETWSEADRTSFTFASRNLKDFKNSMAVMLDGIFFPLIGERDHEWIYRQEGWRLETMDDETSLYISGNAYNRARASQMFPEEALDDFVHDRLFKEHTYGYNPRGLWNEILSGVRGHMIKFYNSWYHPSNGRVFCYGAPEYVNACLHSVDEAVTRMLHDQDKKTADAGGVSVLEELGVSLPQDSKVGFKMLNTIKSVEERVPYPSFEETDDFRLAISWVLNDEAMSQRHEVAWYLIYEMLIGSATATIAKELETLGDDYIAKLNTDLQQWTMTMGVSGLPTEASAGEARTKIVNKLAEISQNGFDREAMAAALNKVEFKLRDLNSCDGSPQGVVMFKKVLRKWNYDLDPTLALNLMDEFQLLRTQLEDPDNVEGMEFILELMTKGLSDNTAQAIATIYPSAEMQSNVERNEIIWLNDSDQYWDKATGLEIMRETAELHRIQQQGDSAMDIATIPRLSPFDLPKEAFEIPTTIKEGVFDSDLTMLENLVPESNNIAYVDFTIDISNMAFKDTILLPLICRLLAEAGTERKSDVEIRQHIDLYTGGLTVEPLVEEVYEFQEDNGYKVDSGKHMITKILIRTSCFAEKGCAELFNLIKTLIYDSVIDERDKVINILQDIVDDLEDDIQQHGHVFTTRRIESRYTLPGFIREQWFGITQLYKARAALLEAEDDTKWDALGTRLLVAHDAIKRTHHSGLLLSITGDEKAISDLGGAVHMFVKDMLPASAQRTPFPDFGKVEHPWVINGNLAMNKEMENEDPFTAFLTPTLVNDVGRGGFLYQPGEHISGAHMAAVQYIGGFFLNEKIRFNLGASQAWAQLDLDSGVVIYQSEETPSIYSTLEIFRDATGWVQRQLDGHENLPVEAQAAIIGMVGKMDGSALQPNRVGHVALLQYLKQDTKEGRQAWRDEALKATKEDFMFFANRLAGWGGESLSAITNQGLLDQAHLKMENRTMTSCHLTGFKCPESTEAV